MRTVDPYFWYKKVKKQPLNVTRTLRFGVEDVSVFEKRLRRSFRDAMQEFVRNCSVDGVKFIIDKNNPRPLRWCYLIVLVISISCGLSIVAWNISCYNQRPRLMVSKQILQHALQRIDFPAVGICSNNIISRTALQHYAQFLYSLDRNKSYSIEEIKNNLLAFGAIQTLESYPYDVQFVMYLNNILHETNITKILYRLSPDCMTMLEHCSWQARRIRCPWIFAKRITSIGFCCIFNSRYHPVDWNNAPQRAKLPGEDNGLSVVVREDPDDFTHVQRPLQGFDVLLFDGNQYPTAGAGIIKRVMAARNASVFIQLTAHVQEADDDLLVYSDEWLECRMKRPGNTLEATWGWCVSECRRQASLAMCQCAPHHTPPFNDTRAPPCSVEHVPCLAKHKDKFTSIYPGDDVHESLSEEQADSIECPNCSTECARLRHSATVTTVPYDLVDNKIFLNKLLNGLNTRLMNTTILKIYYTTEKSQLLMLEKNVPWYEVSATIVSQWVMIVGLTVLSVHELLYHCTFRWYYHYMKRWQEPELQ